MLAWLRKRWISGELAATGFLVAVLVSNFTAIWDPDFFWHLRNGQWILEHGAFPSADADPFGQFPSDADNARFFGRAYWLAQVLYAAAFRAAGFPGIAALKAIPFAVVFLAALQLWRVKRVRGAYVALALVPAFAGLVDFRSDRPQLFSFAGFAVLLLLLETKRWRWMPVLMALWSNLHGGFVIGVVAMGAYCAAALWRSFRGEQLDRRLLGWGAAAVVATLVNPNGPRALRMAVQIHSGAGDAIEYLTPLQWAVRFDEVHLPFFALLGVSVVLCLIGWKREELSQKLLVAAMAVLSLTAMRYVAFFLIAGSIFAAIWLEQLTVAWAGGAPGRRVQLGLRLAYGVGVALLCLLFVGELTDGAPSSGIVAGRYPAGAVAFVRETRPASNLLNLDHWGGYLGWQLPEYKVFTDTRGVSQQARVEEGMVLAGQDGWLAVLDRQAINFVVVSAFNPIVGSWQLPMWNLLQTPGWRVVFADPDAVVFVRENETNRSIIAQHGGADLQRALDHALDQALRFTVRYPHTAWHWENLGQVYGRRGQLGEALGAYRRALECDPASEDARKMVEFLAKRTAAPN